MEFSWIDIVIVAIFIISTIKGLAQGFVKSFLSFALIIASLIAAKIFSPKLALYFIDNARWVQNLKIFIEKKVITLFGGTLSSVTWTDSTQIHNAPNALQQFLDSFMLTANKTLGNISDAFANNVTTLVVNIISFLAILIVLLILGNILIAIINRFAQLPILRVFNRTGGLLVGMVKGIIIICILATIIYYSNLMLGMVELSTAINNSFLIKYFYLSFLFS